MSIIIGYLAFCLFVSLGSKKYPKITAIIIFLVGTFINGFRSVTYTFDNVAYIQYYSLNASKSLLESWQEVLTQTGKDPFYYFVGNLFSKMGFSYRGWFVFIAIIYMAGFCYLMYKHSENYFISVLFMVALSYYYFSMTGLRQTLAMGILFFAFEMAYNRRLIPFVILVLLASLFHSSALLFLVFYVLKNVKIAYKHWVALIVAVGIAYSIPGFINNAVSLLAWNDSLANYSFVTSGLTAFGLIIQVCIILFSQYFTWIDEDNEIIFRPIFNALFIGAIIQAFAININNIFRMSMYFSIYGAFMITTAIESQREDNRKVLYILVSVLLVLYMFRAGNYRYFSLFGDI